MNPRATSSVKFKVKMTNPKQIGRLKRIPRGRGVQIKKTTFISIKFYLKINLNQMTVQFWPRPFILSETILMLDVGVADLTTKNVCNHLLVTDFIIVANNLFDRFQVISTQCYTTTMYQKEKKYRTSRVPRVWAELD